MRLFNGIPIPDYLRITNTTEEGRDATGRKHEEWGNVIVKHPEESEYHLLTEKERKDE